MMMMLMMTRMILIMMTRMFLKMMTKMIFLMMTRMRKQILNKNSGGAVGNNGYEPRGAFGYRKKVRIHSFRITKFGGKS